MKLVAALSLCAGASAVNVESLFKEVSGKVFKQNKDGFKVSLEPYFTLNCKHKINKNGAGQVKFMKASCAGASGAGGETNPFSRKVIYNSKKGFFSYLGTDEGNTGNWVGSQYYMPEGYGNADFWVNEQVKVTYGDIWKTRVDYTRKGGMAQWGGNDKSKPAAMIKNTVQLKEGGLVDGEYAAKVKINGLSKIPADLPVELNPMSMRTTSWQMTVDVNADQACSAGPQEPGCTMRGSVRGKAGGNKLSHAISFENNGGAIYTVVLEQPSKTCTIVAQIGELFTINWKTTGEPNKLVIQLPNVIEHVSVRQAIIDAAMAAIAPFRAYGQAAITTPNTAAHAVVWVDRRINKMNNEFDCSALFAATQFESDLIAEAHNLGMSVQSFVQAECKRGNAIAVEWLKNTAVPAIEDARTYVNNLTDETVGGVEYDTWAANNL